MRFSALACICLLVLAALLSANRPRIRVVAINTPVTPMTAYFLHRNLEEASRQGDRLVVVEMDTPGGLDGAMREAVKDIMASPVPVVVYVAPSGARAASAGAIIAMASDLCAMAPGTNIGAAHPVSLAEKPDKVMADKIANDAEAYAEGIARMRGRDVELAGRMVRDSISLTADKALAGGIIDLIARDRSDLLRQLEGRPIRHGGRELVLQLSGAEELVVGMGRIERFLNAISNPDVAYVLMMLGMIGLFFELSNPGVILPGVFGGIALILAFFAFQALPVNYAGLLLILLGLILFVAEIKVVSHGILTIGGMVALMLGSLMLFEASEPYQHVSLSVLLVMGLATAGFFGFAVNRAIVAQRLRPTTGREGLIGQEGLAETGIDGAGKVFVRGEYWDARSDEPISAGSRIEVEGLEGMRLKVKMLGE